jgi:hypothetical protein
VNDAQPDGQNVRQNWRTFWRAYSFDRTERKRTKEKAPVSGAFL